MADKTRMPTKQDGRQNKMAEKTRWPTEDLPFKVTAQNGRPEHLP